VRQGFKGYAPKVEGFIAAKSYLMKKAMETEKGVTRINPALMKVSFGTLPLSKDIAVKPIENDQLQFTWDPTLVDQGDDYDQAMLLAYDIKKEKATYTIAGEFTHRGSATLLMPNSKGSFHIWLAFVAVDRNGQSYSIYLGEIKN
jgi:uncharacterized protein DUF6266